MFFTKIQKIISKINLILKFNNTISLLLFLATVTATLSVVTLLPKLINKNTKESISNIAQAESCSSEVNCVVRSSVTSNSTANPQNSLTTNESSVNNDYSQSNIAVDTQSNTSLSSNQTYNIKSFTEVAPVNTNALVCVGDNQPNQNTYLATNGLCYTEIPVSGLKCFDLVTLPDGNGNCGPNSAPMFNCSANVSGQVTIFSGGDSGQSICSKTPQFFSTMSCQELYFTTSGSPQSGAGAQTAIMNRYNNYNVNYVEGTNSGFYGNQHLCNNGATQAQNTNGCPANWIPFFSLPELGHSYSGKYMTFLCMDVDLYFGTAFEANPIPGFNARYSNISGSGGGYLTGNGNCGDLGMSEVAYFHTSSSGAEATRLCAITQYPASVPCPVLYGIGYTDPGNARVCYRSFSPTTITCTAGTYFTSVSNSCVQCPANNYCLADVSVPSSCSATQTSPAGSTSQAACVENACTNGANNPPSCNQCPVTLYFNATAGSCQVCPVGNTCSGVTAQPVPCTAGTYALNNVCTQCPANKYCGPATSVPSSCSATQTSPAGSTSQAACVENACTNGANNPPSCNQCPVTLYFNATAGSCQVCPVGNTCSGVTAQPVPCTAGTYALNNVCTQCPANKYCGPATSVPSSCSANTFSAPGSKLISDCTPPSGEVIVIKEQKSSSSQSSQSIISSIAETKTPETEKVFKSKLRITDPYVCGVGSYGNVPNPQEFGVEFVYYDFYRNDSKEPSYKFKLRLNSNGDFFLPISPDTNIIKEGNYKIVFYAIDNEGGKAEGQYIADVTDNCTKNIISSVRTGGYSLFTLTIFSLISGFAYYKFNQQKVKRKELNYDFERKV
jgi:hypothetical protein